MAATETPYEHKDVSRNYTKYRPTYSEELIDTIIKYCKEGGASFKACLDLACGTGISTEPLLKYYEKVIGVDGSESQIKEARAMLPQVDFHVGSAEDLNFLPDNSVDLVTVATAFHWFKDRESVYNEVKRVLRNNGVLAIYTYTMDVTPPSLEVRKFYKETLADYIPSAYKEQHDYSDIQLPFADFKKIEGMTITKRRTLPDYIGFVRSAWPYQQYIKNNPNSDELDKLSDRIRELVQDGEVVEEYPLILLVGRKQS
eukprot:GHVU01006866.1.p1 GENE.GHVU01006866.1~~GHVU01006866.1.p1  ORF type:complete len:257 (+),score=22.29 GHVU01006866.1:43-813(+)